MKGGGFQVIDIEGGRNWLAFAKESGEGGEEGTRVFFAQSIEVQCFENCGGGEADRRLDDIEVRGGGEGGDGFEDLSAAGAVGSALGEEECDVRAEFLGPFNQVFVSRGTAEELIGCKQGGGGIAAPTTEAGLDRGAFLEIDLKVLGFPSLATKQIERPQDQVALVCDQGRERRGELVLCGRGGEGFEEQGIPKGDGLEEGGQLVVAVFTTADDAEEEVDLGGRKEFQVKVALFSS